MQRDSMEISSLFPLEIPGNMTVLYKHWHSQLRLEKNSTRYVMKRLHKALGELLLELYQPVLVRLFPLFRQSR